MIKKKILTILMVSVICTGCSPIFLKEDNPVILDNSTGLSENQTPIQGTKNDEDQFLIQDINNNITEGMVYDISEKGELLLMGVPTRAISDDVETIDSYSNLHTYNIKNEQQKQILVSTKEQSNAFFDEKNKGIFYAEFIRNKDGQVNPDSYKLNWTDSEGSQTKNISLNDEIASPKFSLIDDDLVVYGNTKGQIHLIKTRDIRRKAIPRETFTLSKKLNIYKVDYFPKQKIAFFLASNPKTKDMDLYYALLEDKDKKVDPLLVQSGVTNFALSRQNKTVLYSVMTEKRTQLVSIDLNYSKKAIYEGSVCNFSYTPDQKHIIYQEKTDDSSNNQNLWIMNADGSKSTQLASNLKISSDRVVFSPDMHTIYFSVLSIEKADEDVLKHNVYAIHYAPKE